MIVRRKSLPRRTLLRGLGTAIALPMLDAMIPAFASRARADHAKVPKRLVFVYVPNGITMKDWTPSKTGRDFQFTRILKPLEPFRASMLVLSGLAHRTGRARAAGDHARAGGTYLTGVCPKRTTRASEIALGISVDQVAAQAFGSETRLPSLELGCDAVRMVGGCDAGYSCVYQASMSWRSSTTPMPPESDPRQVFERLYGSLDTNRDPKVRAQLETDHRSVLDFVNQRTQRLMGQVGASDRHKLDEYLTAIRDIEKRIQRVEGENREIVPSMEKPDGIPTNFVEYVSLMQDLLVAALQADLTRVATLMYGRESDRRSYPYLGFTDSHHPVTHHRNMPAMIEKVTKINCHHVDQFAKFVAKAAAIQDGDGSLLDHSMLVYGSGLSDGNRHDHLNLPVVVLGHGDRSIKTGQHIKYAETPMTNLYLTLLDRMGVPAETLGDSTGKLEHLADV